LFHKGLIECIFTLCTYLSSSISSLSFKSRGLKFLILASHINVKKVPTQIFVETVGLVPCYNIENVNLSNDGLLNVISRLRQFAKCLFV